MDWDALRERNPELYRVAHEGITEPEFSGKYVHTNDTGTYYCAVCGAPLFSSGSKFSCDIGWPCFIKPVSEKAVVLITEDEYGVHTTEVRCATCNAHLGRVLPDGPTVDEKTYNRYSINSISLELKPN